MAFIKCIDCGKIYDTSLEACPQCGCPTEQQQLPPVFNSDDNVPVDATSIFNIKEDKFEETKDIRIATRGKLSTSVDDLCKSLQAQSPQVHLTYHMEKGVGQLLVCYDEKDFLKKIDSNHNKALANKYSCACKRLIINIDDKDNIRLDLENNESKWKSDFPISQEMFLKCCRAEKLEFKISKENEESILVNGYYGFDPESGAEVDANGNIVPENELILNFQALYNYVIDPNIFKDALPKRQRLDEWNKKQTGSSAHGKQKEAGKNEKHGVDLTRNPRALIILITVLSILFVLFAVIDSGGCQSTITRNELYGKWAYSGSGICYVWFWKGGKCEIKQLRGLNVVEESARYEVNGRNVIISYDDGRSSTLRLSHNKALYASDGTEYIKVEDF